jgi:hypothetical protein
MGRMQAVGSALEEVETWVEQERVRLGVTAQAEEIFVEQMESVAI